MQDTRMVIEEYRNIPIQASVFNIFQDVKYTKDKASKKDFSNNNNKSNKLWQQMDI